MRLVVCSAVDPASVNIRTALLALAPWREEGAFDGSPVYRHLPLGLVTLRDEHLYRDHVDREIAEALGQGPEAVIYASRHRSAAGRRALTTHPIGNFGEARYGGKPGTLVPAAPAVMSSLLREMRRAAAGMSLEVTLECTHHGPLLTTPTCYVEVGSDESGWQDAEAAAAVARAILACDPSNRPVAIGFGGGHYVPRMTDLAANGTYDLGHMASVHDIEAAGAKAVDLALAATPGAAHAVFQTRASEREAHDALRERARILGLSIVEPG